MAEPFIDFHLKPVVIGSGLPQDAPDNLNLRVVERSLAIDARPQRPGNRPVVPHSWNRFPNVDGLDGIRSLRQERMMESARADIPNDQSCIGCELALDAQVPLVYVIALDVVVIVGPHHLRWPDRGRQRRNSVRPCTRRRRGCTGRTNRAVVTQKGSRRGVIEIVDVRLRQRIKYPKAAADCRLAVMKRIPGETHARLEVLQCEIAGVKLTDQVR